MKVVVLNSGSSTLKFQVFEMPSKRLLAKGIADRIGLDAGVLELKTDLRQEKQQVTLKDHEVALKRVLGLLEDPGLGVLKSLSEVELVGHRIVHGGEDYSEPVVIDDKVMNTINNLSFLAPLHNPANLKGVEVAKRLIPGAKQVGVFDTAFHQTNPEKVWRYALPEHYYTDYKIRGYGFHGTSHKYIAKEASKFLGIAQDKLNLISCHLGNGCSMAMVKHGKSYATSMGFTPSGGLIMGTRPGDIDAGIMPFLVEQAGLSVEEVVLEFNKASGMKALTGHSDLREVEEQFQNGNQRAILAMQMYADRIVKYIGSFIALMGEETHAISFTGGVGENSSLVRHLVLSQLRHMGIKLDGAQNDLRTSGNQVLSSKDSLIKVVKIPTNEELEIAEQAFGLLSYG